jgi:hypothetical protein
MSRDLFRPKRQVSNRVRLRRALYFLLASSLENVSTVADVL